MTLKQAKRYLLNHSSKGFMDISMELDKLQELMNQEQ